jgi:Tfp pilus assembly protein PilF
VWHSLIPPFQGRSNSFATATRLRDDAVQKDTDVSVPFVERSYHNRRLAYFQSKQYSAARQDCDKAIELNAQDADAYLGRGVPL